MEEPVTISTIGGGVLNELFAREMEKVAANILDLNAEATAVRAINIKIKIKPDANRNFGHVAISVSSNIASQSPFGATMFFGKQGGVARAIEPPRQNELFPVERPRPVVNFNTGTDGVGND